MHDASFNCCERLFIKLNGTRRIADCEGWCNRVVTVGNGFYGHKNLLGGNSKKAVYNKTATSVTRPQDKDRDNAFP